MYRLSRSVVKRLAVLALVILPGVAARGGLDESLEEARAQERLLQRLDAALRAGDVDRVLAVFEDSLQGVPLHPRLLNLKGVALAARGRHEEAVRAYEAGLRENLGFHELHLNLAISLEALGVTGRAFAEFEQAAELAPESLEARLGLGRASTRFRRYDRAASELAAAHRLAPEDPRVLRALAELADAMADDEGALTWWSRLEERMPSADSARRLAEIGDQAPGRLEWYRKCLDRDPQAADCAAAVGALLLAEGNAVDAIDPLQKAVAQADPPPEAVHNLLLALQLAGRRTALETVIAEHPPRWSESWGVVALARRADGDLEGALVAARKAVDLQPDSLDLVNLLAVILDQSGDREAARRRWEWILSQDPQHPEAKRNLAERSR